MSVLDNVAGRNSVRTFIRINEGLDPKVYLDHKKIPTVGVGYALVTRHNGVWIERPGLEVDLRQAGILGPNKGLSATDRQRLVDAANNLNLGIASDNDSIIKTDIVWDIYPDNESELLESQTTALFDNIIGGYESIAIDQLRQGRQTNLSRQEAEALYESLSENSQITLLDMAFNLPLLIGKGLSQALRDGDTLDAWFEIRFRSNARDGINGRDFGIDNRRSREALQFDLEGVTEQKLRT